MKKLHFLLSTFLVFIFTSCGEDELKGVVLSEDPGYVKEPLVAIQAEDGTGNWINGLIDQNSRVIALDFRILDDQSAVNVKLKLADEWAKPIDPLTTDAVLDLSSGITRIKVNDGADDIEYTIFSTSTQLLRGVTATCNTEQVSANFINGIASLRFKQNTAFANVVLMPTLADNAEIISTDPVSQKDENGNLRYVKASNQNELGTKNIEDIITAYQNRVNVDKFVHVATRDEIIQNDYNLNIPRYVDTFEEEELVDIDEVQQNIARLKVEIAEAEKQMDAYLKELGL